MENANRSGTHRPSITRQLETFQTNETETREERQAGRHHHHHHHRHQQTAGTSHNPQPQPHPATHPHTHTHANAEDAAKVSRRPAHSKSQAKQKKKGATVRARGSRHKNSRGERSIDREIGERGVLACTPEPRQPSVHPAQRRKGGVGGRRRRDGGVERAHRSKHGGW